MLPNQWARNSIVNWRSRELWRLTAPERPDRPFSGNAQSGALQEKPANIGLFISPDWARRQLFREVMAGRWKQKKCTTPGTEVAEQGAHERHVYGISLGDLPCEGLRRTWPEIQADYMWPSSSLGVTC
jgi:hypothetical protein